MKAYKITILIALLLIAGCTQSYETAISQEDAKEMLKERILDSYNYKTHNGHDLYLKNIEKLQRWQDDGGSQFSNAYRITYEYSVNSSELPENVEKIEISSIVIRTGIKEYSYTEITNENINNKIHNFQTCVEAGYEVLEPDCKGCPKQCITPDERIFYEYPPKELARENETIKNICVDMCGDGECQEVVCMAEGCPCAENKNNCPEDC